MIHKLIKKISGFLIFVCLLLISNPMLAQKKKLLIVTDTWPQMEMLANQLMKDGSYHIDKANENEMSLELSQYDFIFMYIHETISASTEQKLIDYTINGGSLIVLHHGISSSNMKNPRWLNFLGIELYPRDHSKYPWQVLADINYFIVNLNEGHFITTNEINYETTTTFNSEYEFDYKGQYKAFQIKNTEIFLNQRFIEDEHRTILFGFLTEEDSRAQPTSGWYSKKGNGRVFYYQAGHVFSDFENHNFIQILLNTLNWES